MVDSAFALANVKAMRWEAILSHLSPVFESATKVDLRKSAVDCALLFHEERVKEPLRVADKAASISFQQAAARALVNPRSDGGRDINHCYRARENDSNVMFFYTVGFSSTSSNR